MKNLLLITIGSFVSTTCYFRYFQVFFSRIWGDGNPCKGLTRGEVVKRGGRHRVVFSLSHHPFSYSKSRSDVPKCKTENTVIRPINCKDTESSVDMSPLLSSWWRIRSTVFRDDRVLDRVS